MLKYIGNPILRKKTKEIKVFDDHLKSTIDKMIELMHQEDGIGLAGPQVGISNSILVVDISSIAKNEQPRAFVNPEIIETEGQSIVEEGCLSIPGVREEITRPEKIKLTFQNERGDKFTEKFDGWMARVLQHEIDHLNGVLFVDHLSPIKRQLLIGQEAIPQTY